MDTVKGMTPIRLAKWLAPQADAVVVGATHAPLRCPLAGCLRTLNSTDYASVGPHFYTVGVGYGTVRHRDTAPWARRFMRLVDLLHGGTINQPVSVQQARECLLRALYGHRDYGRVSAILS